jgi:hypothetical protein
MSGENSRRHGRPIIAMSQPIVGLVKRVWSSTPALTPHAFADNAVVAHADKLSLVSFADGRVMYVDPADEDGAEWLKVLRDLSKPTRRPRPVTVVRKAGTQAIERLQLPLLTEVIGTKKVTENRFDVRFARSASVYTADTSTIKGLKNFEHLRSAVKNHRQLIVTSDDDDDAILDVREPDFEIPEDPPCPLERTEKSIIGGARIISLASARRFFNAVLTGRCRLPRAAGDCLPLHYPDNFCWAIANFVCQRLVARRIACGKVWLFGELRLNTPLRFRCVQRWQFHVAAFVRTSRSMATEDMLVLDPVVSPGGPLPLRDWQERIEVRLRERIITDPRIYRMLSRNNGVCEFPGDTAADLGLMRNALRVRARGRRCPPPYDRCELPKD